MRSNERPHSRPVPPACAPTWHAGGIWQRPCAGWALTLKQVLPCSTIPTIHAQVGGQRGCGGKECGGGKGYASGGGGWVWRGACIGQEWVSCKYHVWVEH
eukprot:126297-Pelagomonas_calceolata.AAC.1